MRDFNPRPYQRLAMQHILERERCALWAGMGMGKTSTSLAVCDLLHNFHGEDRPTLVLAPLRVARGTWPEEARKWRQFADLDIVPIVGTEAERNAALKRDAPIFTVNYEQIPWLVERLGQRWPYGTIIADESTRLKSFRLRQGGSRARALGRVAHKHVRRFVELTGTPAPNGVADLWGQMWFIDQGQRLGRTHQAFTDRWFKLARDGFGLEPLPHAQGEIQALVKDVCLTLDPKDWFDLREPFRNTIHVELPKRARAAYRDMEREMFLSLEGHSIEAFNAASRTIKCLQLANGAAYVGENNEAFVELHNEKLDALESVVEEAAGSPVLVAYHFKSDLARLRKRFPDGIDVATPQGLSAAKAGKGRVWFGHPASMGHGVDGLQEHCYTAAIFGHWWDLEQYDQFVERIGPVRQAQSGHTDRLVTIHHIVARGTVDELVMARRESKRSVQDLLKDAMKGARQ